MKITAMQHLSLDGVMQAPGAADEDLRGGFVHGGWAEARGDDEVLGQAMGPHMSGGLLLGRRSYEGMLGAWNAKGEDHPFAQALNAMPKWVVTRSVTDAAWPNTTLLPGDPVEVVRDLKGQAGPELGVMGSGQLLRAIAPHGLVDEWLLMIHPIVLGSGQRLFDHEGALAELELVDSTISGSGVFVGTYRPAHR